MMFTPVVTESVPARRFSWLGKLGAKGIFDGHHRFIIAATENGTVRFTQSEEITGVFAPILWGLVAAKTRAGFEAMNVALKERAEGR